MSGSVNRVILIGNLGADPDIRTFQNGNKVCNFSVATSERWKDRDGNKQERTQWHTICIYVEGIIDAAQKYLKKGSKVYIQGKLETRKWQDQSGADRYTTEVVVRPFGGEVVFLDPPPNRQNDQRGGQQQNSSGPNDSYQRPPPDTYDEDIPF